MKGTRKHPIKMKSKTKKTVTYVTKLKKKRQVAKKAKGKARVNVETMGYTDSCQVCKQDSVCRIEMGRFADGAIRETMLCQKHAIELATQIATRVAVA